MKLSKTKTLPKATHKGDIQLGDITISCAVLDDGRRVLTQSDYLRALGRSPVLGGRKSGYAKEGSFGGVDTLNSNDINELTATPSNSNQPPDFLRSKSLKPFISNDLAAVLVPFHFVPLHGGEPALGFLAETLPLVCIAFIDASRAGKLHPKQKPSAQQAYKLGRAFMQTGILALIDEATGYQVERAPDNLQKRFNEFFSPEPEKWTRTFSEVFYSEIYRLKNLKWFGTRPRWLANITNDLIYVRIAPGVKQELNVLNPADENGYRKNLHHQHLSRDFGHPVLEKHIHAVVGLMKAADTWPQFHEMLERAFPKYDQHTGELEVVGMRRG